MPSYLERYQAGEHEQVWSELTALGDAVRTEPLFSDAMAVARETASRALHNIEILIARLENIDYQFGLYAEGDPIPGYKGALTPPSSDIAGELDTLEAVTGPLPLSLRAWYEVVGSVSFMGYHPKWETEYPDPLVVDGPWIEHHLASYRDWQEQCEEEEDETESFEYEFAPDYFHKANVSGGPPYGVVLPCPSADAPVVNEPHETAFVDYLRICFRWGGLPGFEEKSGEPEVQKTAAYLTEGLLAL